MREWVGMEGLCEMMVDDPQLVHDMAETWRTFTLAVLETLLRRVRLDILFTSEDMAYKAHSMISPAMTRRFLQPTYFSWRDLLKSYGDAIIDMDSDGYIPHLIPIWIESGITACDPIEVAAGNDIVAFRQAVRPAYGLSRRHRQARWRAGGQVMRDEVLRVAPLIAGRRLYPELRPRRPARTSRGRTSSSTTRLLAQLEGWL